MLLVLGFWIKLIPGWRERGKFNIVRGGVKDRNRTNVVSKYKHLNVSIVRGGLNGSS